MKMTPHHEPSEDLRPVALITGAGSGIGRALAVLLSRNGYNLALVGRRIKPLESTAALLSSPCRTIVVSADIADLAQAGAIISETIGRLGRLDVLVSNAGIAPIVPIDRTTPALLHDVYNTNALGPASLIAAAWPIFTSACAGRIICTSTLGTRDPFPGFFAYAAAKSAVNSMIRSCAREGKRFNIKAFAIAPGAVETEMLRANFSEKLIPPAAALAPETVAQLMADCIAGTHDDRNGQTIYISASRGIE